MPSEFGHIGPGMWMGMRVDNDSENEYNIDRNNADNADNGKLENKREDKNSEPNGNRIMTFTNSTLYGNYLFLKGDTLEGKWNNGKLDGNYKLIRGGQRSLLKFDNHNSVSEYKGNFNDEFNPDGKGNMTFFKSTKYGIYDLLKDDTLEGEWNNGKLKHSYTLTRYVQLKHIYDLKKGKVKLIEREDNVEFSIGGYRKTKKRYRKRRKNKFSRKNKKNKKSFLRKNIRKNRKKK